MVFLRLNDLQVGVAPALGGSAVEAHSFLQCETPRSCYQKPDLPKLPKSYRFYLKGGGWVWGNDPSGHTILHWFFLYKANSMKGGSMFY